MRIPAKLPYMLSVVVVLKPLVKTHPSRTELRQVLAQGCLDGKDYQFALAEFCAILERNQNSPAIHILLREAFDGMGRTGEVITEFKAAVQLDSRQPL